MLFFVAYSFVDLAHKAGLAVFLKPVVVCGGECTMVNVNPTNLSEWFVSYMSYITSFAQFCEEIKVDVLSVVLELEFSGVFCMFVCCMCMLCYECC
jgi:hypothetical protein